MAKEISSFNQIPTGDEVFADFFRRSFVKVMHDFPETKFWLIEQFGKRASFIAGEMDEFSFNPVKKHLIDNYYLFFSRDGIDEEIEKIFSYYAAIYAKYFN